MNILSSFTLPRAVPNLYGFLLLDMKAEMLKNVGNQKKINKRIKSTVDVNGCHQLSAPTFFKISSFVFYREEKLIQGE